MTFPVLFQVVSIGIALPVGADEEYNTNDAGQVSRGLTLRWIVGL